MARRLAALQRARDAVSYRIESEQPNHPLETAQLPKPPVPIPETPSAFHRRTMRR
jgi:hypothetical protein